ncbi:MAG: BMP family ABC transporter substrate-binding protein [Nitrospinota bacterium]
MNRWQVRVFSMLVLGWFLLGPTAGLGWAQPRGPIKKVKAALVLPGPVGDAGWNLAHMTDFKAMKKVLPSVEIRSTEMVPVGSEAERVFMAYARRGFHVIFAGSTSYTDSAVAVAKRFPELVIMVPFGYRSAPNVGNYYVRDYQVGYLAGVLAGRMTKKNIVGVVGTYPIPNIIMDLNAFAIGMRSVNPKAKLHLVWIQSWYDPAREREAADSVMDVGADVVAQLTDSPAVQQAAERRGRYAIGMYSDMSAFAPKYHLTSRVWKWDGIFIDVVKRLNEGTWKNDKYLWGLKEDAVALTPFNKVVPVSVRQLVEERRAALKEGRLKIFAGLIRDQKGAVRVPAGKQLSYSEAWNLGFLVEGIVGNIPK